MGLCGRGDDMLSFRQHGPHLAEGELQRAEPHEDDGQRHPQQRGGEPGVERLGLTEGTVEPGRTGEPL